MRLPLLIAATLAVAAAPAGAQRIVEVPASEVDVARPEDLYSRAPDRWHLARELWRGDDPAPTRSARPATPRAISRSAPSETAHRSRSPHRGAAAGSTAYSQLDIGERAVQGRAQEDRQAGPARGQGLGKTCKAECPKSRPLTGDWLFPEPVAAPS
jgi:hypothetical protein